MTFQSKFGIYVTRDEDQASDVQWNVWWHKFETFFGNCLFTDL